jgi:carbamoylphosphate synthase large subunit
MTDNKLVSDTTRTATSLPEARRILGQIGLPVVICPAFTIGRQTIGATTDTEFEDAIQRGLDASATTEVLIEPAEIASQ